MPDETTAPQSPLDRFMAAYEPALYAALKSHPDDYAYGPEEVPRFLPIWRKTLQSGNFNHSGPAMRGACRALGIRPTRKAILAFLAGEASPTG